MILQRQRLVAEHRLDHDRARKRGIERMRGDQIGTFFHDEIGILGDLQLLVAVMAMKPHALAEHFQDVDDAEGLVALMRAQLTVIGMVDRDQCVDAGTVSCLELRALQLA